MSTNHQMNYYDYGKTLDIQGVMLVIGGGVSPEPTPTTIIPKVTSAIANDILEGAQVRVTFDGQLPEGIINMEIYVDYGAFGGWLLIAELMDFSQTLGEAVLVLTQNIEGPLSDCQLRVTMESGITETQDFDLSVPEPEPEKRVGYAGSTSGSWLFISVNHISYDPEMPPQVSGIYYWDDIAGQSFYISGGFEYQPEQEGWFSQLTQPIDFNQEYKLQISIEGINYNYKVSWYEYTMPEPEPVQHEYVDLSLPSGTLWATENIKDADGNELYFSWGSTQGYTSGQVGTEKNFTWDDYEFGSGLTKYNVTDGKTELDEEDDAATANWGSNWRMPTKEQFDELISSANTTTAWTQVDGVNGLLCTSKANNNTLFFPAVGSAGYGKVGDVGGFGNYWSVSLNDGGVSGAWKLDFGGGSCVVLNNTRYFGFSVRPVRSNS